MTSVTSCIVANPPDFTDPTQTPPELNVYGTTPLLNHILVVKSGQIVPLTVPVRSEDAGEDLTAIFFLDYGTPNSFPINQQTISASTYNGPDRDINTSWTVVLRDPCSAGQQCPPQACHTLTLVVAHRSSFQNSDATLLDPGKAKTDASFVQWWVNANAPDDAQTTLTDCPVPSLTSSP
ncbi:MAG TPA: hypothetical protein VHW01_08540 [Polyangiaceae bacterium]|nr:hypothetical protein [Polyangiaceae bacterium]